MKRFLSIGLAIFLFSGCGGGGGSDTTKKVTVDEALKIGDVVFSAPQDIDFNNKVKRPIMKRQKRVLKLNGQYMQKESAYCDISGTYEADESYDGTGGILVFHDCIAYNKETGLIEYYNGTMTIKTIKEMENEVEYEMGLNDYTEILDYYNNSGTKTYYEKMSFYYHAKGNNLLDNEGSDVIFEEMKIDGEEEDYKDGYLYERMKFTDFTFKNKAYEKAWYYSGSFYDKAGCFSEGHDYKTDDKDWLIESSVNPDYFESGTLYVDNIKYVYHGDKVTVTKDGKTGTFTQQELLDELNKEKGETECSL